MVVYIVLSSWPTHSVIIHLNSIHDHGYARILLPSQCAHSYSYNHTATTIMNVLKISINQKLVSMQPQATSGVLGPKPVTHECHEWNKIGPKPKDHDMILINLISWIVKQCQCRECMVEPKASHAQQPRQHSPRSRARVHHTRWQNPLTNQRNNPKPRILRDHETSKPGHNRIPIILEKHIS